MSKKIIQTSEAPQAIGTYSQAVKVGNTVYISGQIPIDPKTGTVCSENFREQTKQVFNNLLAIAHKAGGDLSHIVKLNAYLVDLNYFTIFNEIMAEYIKEPYPARAAVEVSRLPKDVLVEAEVILYLD